MNSRLYIEFIFYNTYLQIMEDEIYIVYMPKKLKHIALKEVHYQLLNTCLIISLVGWCYCNCWRYSGCRAPPIHTNLSGERNYCIICQIKKTFNLDKMYNLTKVQDVFNIFLELKKELQIFLSAGYSNFWLYHYSQEFYHNRLGTNRRKTNKMYLKNYIKQNYYNICYLDP